MSYIVGWRSLSNLQVVYGLPRFNLYLRTINLEGALGKPKDLIEQLIREKENLSLQEINLKLKLKEIQKTILTMHFEKIPKSQSGVSVVDEIEELLNTEERRAVIQGKQHSIFLAEDSDVISAKSSGLLKELIDGVKHIYSKMIPQSDKKMSDTKAHYAIDIEFKIMFDEVSGNKKVYIKQARPLILGADE